MGRAIDLISGHLHYYRYRVGGQWTTRVQRAIVWSGFHTSPTHDRMVGRGGRGWRDTAGY